MDRFRSNVTNFVHFSRYFGWIVALWCLTTAFGCRRRLRSEPTYVTSTAGGSETGSPGLMPITVMFPRAYAPELVRAAIARALAARRFQTETEERTRLYARFIHRRGAIRVAVDYSGNQAVVTPLEAQQVDEREWAAWSRNLSRSLEEEIARPDREAAEAQARREREERERQERQAQVERDERIERERIALAREQARADRAMAAATAREQARLERQARRDEARARAEQRRAETRARRGAMSAGASLDATTLRVEVVGTAPATAPDDVGARCERGDAAACHRYGYALWNGEGYSQDRLRAIGTWQEGCELGHPGSCWEIGYQLAWGENLYLPLDYTRALAIFNRFCRRGHAQSCTRLGVIEEYGLGTAADDGAALRGYVRGCRGGDPYGCWYEGMMVRDGRATRADSARAYELFDSACSSLSDACADRDALAQSARARPDCRAAVLAAGHHASMLVHCEGVEPSCAVALVRAGHPPAALVHCGGVDASCAEALLASGQHPANLVHCR